MHLLVSSVMTYVFDMLARPSFGLVALQSGFLALRKS